MGIKTSMYIEIIDDKFGEDNFEYDVYLNGKIVEKNPRDRKIKIDDVCENDIIEVRARNIILSSKYGWMFMLLYWVLSLLSGMSEQNPFGKPFDAYIKFRAKSNNIKLRGRKIWDKQAFMIHEGTAEIMENNFLSTGQQRIRWCFGMVLPLDILIGFILGVCIYIAKTSMVGVVFGVPLAISGLCWNFYACRVVKVLKRMN